jgi:peptide/nickel transport system substrate-binding protein
MRSSLSDGAVVGSNGLASSLPVAGETRRAGSMLTRRTLLHGASAGVAVALGHLAIIQAESTRVLRFVPQAAYSAPDPVWTSAIIVATHAFMVWDTLHGVDINLTPHPQMCAGHVVSDGGLTWTFTLRDGLLFHDGGKVRVQDVIASVQRWAQRDTFGQLLLSLATKMTALDDKRLRIQLTEPFPLMLYALGAQNCFIMPGLSRWYPRSEQLMKLGMSG